MTGLSAIDWVRLSRGCTAIRYASRKHFCVTSTKRFGHWGRRKRTNGGVGDGEGERRRHLSSETGCGVVEGSRYSEVGDMLGVNHSISAYTM